jgi:hypothetical protein
VVDRLRGFLNRPLRDGERPRLFATVVAVVVGAAAVLALLDDVDSPQPRRAAEAQATDRPGGSPRPAAEPLAAAEPPSEEGILATGLRRHVAQAKLAARRFLAGYLPYSYGQGDARAINHADPGLRRRLSRERPRVPAQEQRRRPRVELLHADGAGPDRARMVALVSDGRRRYKVDLELARARFGWRVTAVGS